MSESMFSYRVPRLQTAWDSTSMKLLQECPRKYQLTILDQWYSVRAKPQLTFGIAIHKAFETYHRARAEGAEYEEALRRTIKFALSTKAEWAPGDTLYNSFNLARAVAWYLDQFKSDPAETYILANGKPGVELSFRFALPIQSPDGEPHFWCGHIDRVVSFQGDVLVTDYKSTKSGLDQNFVARFSPNNQITGYIVGGSTIIPGASPRRAFVDGIELKVNFNRFARIPIERTPDQLREWLHNTAWWIRLAEVYAEEDFWPMNLESCDKWGGCVFRKTCAKDPAVREHWLKNEPGEFTKREWNPLISREP